MQAQTNPAGHVSGHVFLVKRKRGDVFYCKFRVGRRQVQRKLGPAWRDKGRPPAGYFTMKTAEAQLAAILTDARRGQLPAGVGRSGATFGSAAREWLHWIEHDRKRRPSTVTDYRRALGALLAEFGETTPLEAVTAERIDAWRARVVAEGRLSARTINKNLVILHGIFRRANVLPNPAAQVDRQPLARSGDFNVLTPAEVEALARNAADAQDAAMFRVAAFTGLRLGELLALRFGDADFSKRLVHVRRSYSQKHLGAPKSGKVRSVPLIDNAAVAIDGLSRRERFTGADDLVFCREDGGFLEESRLRRRFHAARDAAGIAKAFRFHDLRHTFGTLAVQAFPLSDVKAFMGHADVSTTMVYVHHVPQHDAAERLSLIVAASDDYAGRERGAVEELASSGAS
jgi:integrase